MPFLLLASIHRAGSHLSSPMGLSSKIVPSFTENCRPQSRHFQIRRVLGKAGVPPSPPAPGATLGRRRAGGRVIGEALCAEEWMASVSELGRLLSGVMEKGYSLGL